MGVVILVAVFLERYEKVSQLSHWSTLEQTIPKSGQQILCRSSMGAVTEIERKCAHSLLIGETFGRTVPKSGQISFVGRRWGLSQR